MIKVNQIKMKPGHSAEELRKHTAAVLRIPEQEIAGLKIVRQSIDARKKPEVFYIYSLLVSTENEGRILRRFKGKENLVCRAEEITYRFPESEAGVHKEEHHHPTIVIVGTGPAGLFCGYFLALHGYRPLLLERGKCVEERRKDVDAFWKSGKLNPASNVQFGEGGAGTFSDGKLNTLVKDKDGRNGIVLDTFVKFGAKESIRYEAKPHIGTDVLCHVVKKMREEILRLGGQVRFESLVKDICIEQGPEKRVRSVVLENGERILCDRLVLAIGHSARDTFSMLYEKGIPMEAKAFAVGLRVEHPQNMINESQYGMEEPGELGAAPYKVAARAKSGRGVYSFCMCPGGYVVNASSEEGHTAINGMSYSGRDGKNANSAVIVTVMPEDFGREHPLAGMAFQKKLEEKAYKIGGGKIPVQRYEDFKRCVEQDGEGSLKFSELLSTDASTEKELSFMPRCKGEFCWTDVSRILPKDCNEAIVEGMENFARQIRGFNRPDACMSGVESRTSSPVRILRGEDMQSEIRGLYPCGEGAGYAGGIMSAAMDGVRIAEAVAGQAFR